ncbi:MAG: hypothetical protein II287_02570 [Bacteroidaceae bacterium]|nr:hypothetical protein [Bacteroidaceae bacterium]
MKSPLSLVIVAIMACILASHTTLSHSTPMPCVSMADTTETTKVDTLRELEVGGQKRLRVLDVLEETRKKQKKQPGQKGISDVIGGKATDYIMHPFAIKERRKEKRNKKAMDALKKLDARTYEDELTDAINRQLMEDSIANAKKEAKQSDKQ